MFLLENGLLSKSHAFESIQIAYFDAADGGRGAIPIKLESSNPMICTLKRR